MDILSSNRRQVVFGHVSLPQTLRTGHAIARGLDLTLPPILGHLCKIRNFLGEVRFYAAQLANFRR